MIQEYFEQQIDKEFHLGKYDCYIFIGEFYSPRVDITKSFRGKYQNESDIKKLCIKHKVKDPIDYILKEMKDQGFTLTDSPINGDVCIFLDEFNHKGLGLYYNHHCVTCALKGIAFLKEHKIKESYTLRRS